MYKSTILVIKYYWVHFYQIEVQPGVNELVQVT